jgi:hypothetical protein
MKPFDAKVGMNDIEVFVHTEESMMSYPAVENITLVMTPDMPSMGHGSPNNENPVHKGNGMYQGKVNFTMGGEWRVMFDVMDGETKLGTAEFYLTL